MTISKDLALAILSMDSYNRGYGAGIGGLDDDIGTQIGTASILKTIKDIADFEDDAKDAGFYAVSYELNGETIISYRGTDGYGDLGWNYPGNLGELLPLFTNYHVRSWR